MSEVARDRVDERAAVGVADGSLTGEQRARAQARLGASPAGRRALEQQQRVVGVEEFEYVADARADPEILLEARAAYAAIAELSVVLRETIVAVDIVGLSYKEAARALGTREGTIMSRLYSARQKVAASLEGRAA